jgi:hypothetical protein
MIILSSYTSHIFESFEVEFKIFNFKTCSLRYKGVNLNYSTTIPKQAHTKRERSGGGGWGKEVKGH